MNTTMRQPSLFWTTVVIVVALLMTLLLVVPVASFVRENSYGNAQTSISSKSVRNDSIRVVSDTDNDGKIEMTTFYKNGVKDRSEIDVNHDGKADAWVSYYINGEVVRTVEDLNFDGKADHWIFFKNGLLYKWEQDRNFDSKVDIRTLFSVGGPGQNRHGNLISQSADDDFDGIFENVVYGQGNEKKIPYSWAEAKYLNG